VRDVRPGDLTGQILRDAFPGASEDWQGDCDSVLASGKPFRCEREVSPQGMVLAMAISPLKDAPGQVLIVTRDVTQRRRAEEALSRSEAQMHALLRASSDIIYSMSADWSEMRQLHGRDMLVDTAAASIRWLEDYIFPEDQPQIRAAIEDAIRRGGTFALEHRVRRADGSEGGSHPAPFRSSMPMAPSSNGSAWPAMSPPACWPSARPRRHGRGWPGARRCSRRSSRRRAIASS
jgi:PAS domain-containing protein